MEKHGKELWKEVTEYTNTGKKEVVLPSYLAGEIQDDFKWFMISLARYKFAGKMLEGKKRILEIGCNYGFKTMMLSQFVQEIVGVDFDEEAIKFAQDNYETSARKYVYADVLGLKKQEQLFDGVICLDVIEHIESEKEHIFMENILNNISEYGVCIIGTPNITAAKYQSEASKIGHINLYSYERLKGLMDMYFHHVFMFSMNDEVVHTGFGPMAHYIFAVGVDKK